MKIFRQNAQKQRVVFLATLIAVLTFFAPPALSQTFTIDLLNLKQNRPGLTGAYFTPNKLRLEEMWNAINESTRTLSPLTIGIIDSDVAFFHPEFIGEGTDGGRVGNVDFGNSPLDAFDEPDFHGTGVTGIIGANNVAGEGFSLSATSTHMNGIVSGVTRLGYTLEVRTPSLSTGHFTYFSHRRAITDLTKNNVAIINISRVFEPGIFSQLTLADKIEDEPNVLFIVAAGNDDKDAETRSPATLGDELPNVITVGGVGNTDERGIYPDLPGSSNFGSAVNISAPSEDFYKPDLFAEPLDLDDYSFDKEGTSFSTPLVTGVAGLLKAINPALTPADIKRIITETADPIFTSDPDELGKTLGSACDDGSPDFRGCRLNALAAVCHEMVLACPKEPFPETSPWPQFQHDARHTGQSSFAGPTKANVKWTFTSSPGFIGTPVIGPGERIYFGIGSPSQGNLVSLFPDGTVRWLSDPVVAAPTNPAIIENGMAFIAAGTEDFGTFIYAFSDEDGTLLWSHPSGERVDFVTLAPDGTLYFTNESGELVSLSADTEGAVENWRVGLGTRVFVNTAPAIGPAGTVYLVEEAATTLRNSVLHGRDPEDGSARFARTVTQGLVSPIPLILSDGTVVVAAHNAVFAFSAEGAFQSAAVLPSGTLSSFAPSAPVLLPDGRIGVVSRNIDQELFLHAVELDDKTVAFASLGTVTGTGSFNEPVVDKDGRVYVGFSNSNFSEDGAFLKALSVSQGAPPVPLFTLPLDFAFRDLALGSGGTLYVPALLDGVHSLVAVGEE